MSETRDSAFEGRSWTGSEVFRLFALLVLAAAIATGLVIASPQMSSPESVDSCVPTTGAGCGLGWIAANSTARVLQAAHQVGAQDRTTAGLNAGPVGNQNNARCLSCEESLRRQAEANKPPSCHYELIAVTQTTRRPVSNGDGTVSVEITHTTVHRNVKVCD